MAPNPEHVRRRTVNKLHAPGATLSRLRELDDLHPGTIVLATSHPEPRYFLRHRSGWLACSPLGDVTEHMTMWAQLDGWPAFLRSRDLRRPVVVIVAHDREDAPCST